MQAVITIKNKREFTEKMRRAPGIMGSYIKTALKKSAFLVERESKKATPVDTGRLRGSITTTIQEFVATVQPKVNYAYWIHEGKMDIHGKTILLQGRGRARTPRGGKPFMTEGLENSQGEINKTFNREINKALKKIK